MATDIITFDFVQALVHSGDRFPVDFEDAWQWLGYTRKSSAKKKLTTNFEGGADFCTKWCNKENTNASGFVQVEEIRLTVECFKELGMLAGTEQGKLVRRYYLDCERIVKEVIPAQSDRIRELELELQIRKQEQKLLDTRNTIVTTCPKPIADRILGITEVKEVEYRDRVITSEGRSDDSVGITYIQKRFGFKTTKAAWDWLDSIGVGKLSGKWKLGLTAVERASLSWDMVEELDMMASEGIRQTFLGEEY